MNLSDFRKDISNQFNRALDEPVYIERGGITFVLSYSMTSKQMLERKNRKTQELANAIERAHIDAKKAPPTIQGTTGSVVGVTVNDIIPIKDTFFSKPLNKETKDYSLCKHGAVKGFCKKGCK